jgi:hypothetical protein
MSTPVVRTDWLTDPVALAVGPTTVALVLALAARAAADRVVVDESVVVAADVVAYYLDGVETERAVAGKLLAPLLVGGRAVAFRPSDWVLARVDTEEAIRSRGQTRERVRRFRARRRDLGQLTLWSGPTQPVENGGPVTRGSVENLSTPGSVTALPVTLAAGPSLDRARAVRTSNQVPVALDLPVPDPPDQPDQPKRLQPDRPVENPARNAKTFRFVLAVVAHVRQTRPEWIAPTGSTDRRDLLDAVRDALTQAGVTTATDAVIRRAIRYVAETAARDRIETARAAKAGSS